MPELTLEIITGDDMEDLLTLDSERLGDYAAHVLRGEGVSEGEINIVFIDDQYMTELNEMYKGREGTTDVLSFNLSGESSGGVNGEVYVSLEQAVTQAAELGVPFDEEVVRLMTHGLLHLAGRVHDTEDQYTAMMDAPELLVREFFSNWGKN